MENATFNKNSVRNYLNAYGHIADPDAEQFVLIDAAELAAIIEDLKTEGANIEKKTHAKDGKKFADYVLIGG